MLVTGHSVLFKIILLLLFVLPCSLKAQVYPAAEVDSLLRTGIDHIVNHKYQEAEKTFTSLDLKFPELPLGKIYLAAVRIAYAYDFETPFDEKYIENNLKEARALSEKLLKKKETDKWNIYFYALSGGYYAYYQALKGNWFDALKTGLSSVSAFEECIELDTDFHEAWIAIGTYQYWKSSKTEFLSWLPFVSDNRDFGIEKLKHAIDSSVYNTHIAIHSLIWIYIDRKDFKAAFELSRYAVEKFPASRIFKWGLARAYEEMDLRKSIETYFEILNSYLKTGVRTRVNEITLKHIIAQQYVKLGEIEKARELCSEILDYKDLTGFEKDKLEERLKRVRTLLEETS
jgi:tetratricopeptide (TPR) repeat protein